ncbi:DUF4249 domain-containing protein [Ancylomarina euxinus]|uniref:DUF4249 domain-containing protein n=1 Tax=Ancylomarina euxinus TaxID=2283627 RepID=A0A425XYE0_9BACT|nr:DUF4249 family protein [Ancylomarina euxinus]MCZ4695814.1 DUF4249 family protein [Ancylomarina euxinus]MUP16123.1 DUF4249 family protein [Ancylomarina euxinus]RRG19844.1 DUF4249 domain-containing protein [Ancylomarina euxinus]
MYRYVLICVLFTSLFSCKEEYPLNLEKNDPILVVDASVNNSKGPHFVRLSKSYSKIENGNFKGGSSEDSVDEPVDDALVIVKDNNGVVDTLKKLDNTFFNSYKDTEFGKKYYYTIEQTNGSVDTVFIFPDSYDLNKNSIYQTSKIEGLPGNTYTIQIKWKDKTYKAEEKMPPCLVIDSTSYRYEKGLPGKDGHYVPLLYFKNPSDIHQYYLSNIDSRNDLMNLFHLTQWYYSVFDTEYFNEYVNGVFLEDGYPKDWWSDNYDPRYEFKDGKYTGFFDVKISSLSENAYNYYKQLSESLGQDGGAYKPAPASAPGNINNGALGYFKVSADTPLTIQIDNYAPY